MCACVFLYDAYIQNHTGTCPCAIDARSSFCLQLLPLAYLPCGFTLFFRLSFGSSGPRCFCLRVFQKGHGCALAFCAVGRPLANCEDRTAAKPTPGCATALVLRRAARCTLAAPARDKRVRTRPRRRGAFRPPGRRPTAAAAASSTAAGPAALGPATAPAAAAAPAALLPRDRRTAVANGRAAPTAPGPRPAARAIAGGRATADSRRPSSGPRLASIPAGKALRLPPAGFTR